MSGSSTHAQEGCTPSPPLPLLPPPPPPCGEGGGFEALKSINRSTHAAEAAVTQQHELQLMLTLFTPC